LDFNKILPPSSLLHLIVQKINFHQKGDHRGEFHSKLKF
jgi:hypothetical protein